MYNCVNFIDINNLLKIVKQELNKEIEIEVE